MVEGRPLDLNLLGPKLALEHLMGISRFVFLPILFAASCGSDSDTAFEGEEHGDKTLSPQNTLVLEATPVPASSGPAYLASNARNHDFVAAWAATSTSERVRLYAGIDATLLDETISRPSLRETAVLARTVDPDDAWMSPAEALAVIEALNRSFQEAVAERTRTNQPPSIPIDSASRVRGREELKRDDDDDRRVRPRTTSPNEVPE
jgi:hypothetical protein